MILVDATPLQSDHRERGIGTYTRCLSAGLARSAPDRIRFLLASTASQDIPAAVAGRALSFRRGHRPAQWYWLYNEWFLRRALRASRPDIFHSTDFNGLVKPRRGRTVATLYDLTPLKTSSPHRSLSARAAALGTSIYFRYKLPSADHVIAISEAVRQDAIRLLDIAPDRVTAVPLGVDTEEFHPIPAQGVSGRSRPYLLFVGNDAPHKNLDRVLMAFAGVSLAAATPIALYVAGPGSNHATIRSRCRALGIGGRVVFLGHVKAVDLPGLYCNALALICPSLHEGFGLPILEAMACGTPVLTSSGGAQAETAGSAALLVDPNDLDELTSALARLVRGADLRERLRLLGLARAAACPWSRTVKQTLSVYDRVLESAPSRPPRL